MHLKEIQLTQGKVALVDDADYGRLNRFKWYAHKQPRTYYAARNIRMSDSKRLKIFMHQVILGLQPGDPRQCDHRDGNGLNNIQSNLRICTSRQNNQSQRKKRKVGTSKYKGVCWHRGRRKWCSRIHVSGEQIFLGLFESEIGAARVYDAAAVKYHGAFALTNRMMGLY